MQMLGVLLGLLVLMLIIGALWWGAQKLLPLIPLSEPFATIVHVLLVLIAVFIVIYVFLALLGAAGISVPMFGRF